jgi:hypothetical protein
MERPQPKFLIFCIVGAVLVNVYEFYLSHQFPNLPGFRDWFLQNYPYEYFLNIVIVSIPTFLIIFLILSYSTSKSRYYRAKPRKVQHFIVGRHKWEVRVYKSGEFFVDENPFCAKHNLRMVNNGIMYECPKKGKNKEHCSSRFLLRDYENIYRNAYSFIENQIKFPSQPVQKQASHPQHN